MFTVNISVLGTGTVTSEPFLVLATPFVIVQMPVPVIDNRGKGYATHARVSITDGIVLL